MKTILKISGPILMVVGLLLVAKFPQPAHDVASHALSQMDLSTPHRQGGVILMGAGVLCLFLQAFLKE